MFIKKVFNNSVTKSSQSRVDLNGNQDLMTIPKKFMITDVHVAALMHKSNRLTAFIEGKSLENYDRFNFLKRREFYSRMFI